MTLFLASVQSAAEAETALAAGADIIDLKDPGRGALGAVDQAAARACLRQIGGRACVSATIGDLPMQPALVRDAVRATAQWGVDYVKLGLFPGGDPLACLEALRAEAGEAQLVLVIFADALPECDAVAAASRIGAHGVMLDTMRKDGRSLTDHLEGRALASFVSAARANGLLTGLAGSLRPAHVSELLTLAPDLLGFRGALCRAETRDGSIDPVACAAIRALIPRHDRSARDPDAPYLASEALC